MTGIPYNVSIRAPDILDNLVPAQDLTCVAHQIRQELELRRCQLDTSVASPHIVAGRIEGKVCYPQRSLWGSAVPTAQRTHAGQKLFGCKRLRQVIVSASIQASHPVGNRIPGRE